MKETKMNWNKGRKYDLNISARFFNFFFILVRLDHKYMKESWLNSFFPNIVPFLYPLTITICAIMYLIVVLDRALEKKNRNTYVILQKFTQ